MSYDRIPYPEDQDYQEAAARAVRLAEEVGEPYAALLREMEWDVTNGCIYADEHDGYPGQSQYGATYKQLAFIAHRAGMTYEERQQWYEIARLIPLSVRHALNIIFRLELETKTNAGAAYAEKMALREE